ncbi:histidinol dehydrogenase [Microbacterium hydrocarbonoxydans]|uniref:histidinol dehydrogenase n=1 Tax=Microbacterium hydrocarbonoxydans TaxID=273678 RepID=UPI0007BBAD77|nr:histidinol dehydrogenase [Microbacterium hydrocarbonoxydans]GAT72582.1 histidinol dehydrogenase [Microbacterium sp. HM58-2]
MRISWISKVLSWVAAALVGGVFGVAGTIGHSVSWGPVPVGMIVGTVACGAILVAIRALTHDRGATLAAGLGMVGMLVLISGVGPGGSVVVEDTAYGRVWIYLVAGLVLLAVAWPRLSKLPVTTQSSASHATGEAAAPLIIEVPGVTGGEQTARES